MMAPNRRYELSTEFRTPSFTSNRAFITGDFHYSMEYKVDRSISILLRVLGVVQLFRFDSILSQRLVEEIHDAVDILKIVAGDTEPDEIGRFRKSFLQTPSLLTSLAFHTEEFFDPRSFNAGTDEKWIA